MPLRGMAEPAELRRARRVKGTVNRSILDQGWYEMRW
jgi:hypothetical protein